MNRFWKRVDKRSDAECWPWIGTIGTWGYGSFWFRGCTRNASRVAWILTHGEIEGDYVVCHTCDNPACCNPSHLFLGTQGDNVRDCNLKGRGKGQYTSDSHPRHTAKLSAEQVRHAKFLYEACGVSQSEIARRLGVDSSTISRAVRGEYWSHVR